MKKNGFTLLEVLIAFAIFASVMTLVLMTVAGSFRSLRQAEVFMLKEQKQRICLHNLGREVSSLTRIDFPQTRFEGDNVSFFLPMPRRITLWRCGICIIRPTFPWSVISRSRLTTIKTPTRGRPYV